MAAGSMLNGSAARLKSISTPQKAKTRQDASEEARIARYTRLNTKKNSEYTKCELEWDQFLNVRPSTVDQSTEDSQCLSERQEENLEEPLPVDETSFSTIQADNGRRKSSRQLAELVEFEELQSLADANNHSNIVNATTADDGISFESNAEANKRIRWNRRVSITRFHKLKAPKEVSTIKDAFRRTSMSDIGHVKKQKSVDDLKPIIRRSNSSNAMIVVASKESTDNNADETIQLSPTKYRVQVKRIFKFENDEDALFDHDDEDGDYGSESPVKVPRKRKRSFTT